MSNENLEGDNAEIRYRSILSSLCSNTPLDSCTYAIIKYFPNDKI